MMMLFFQEPFLLRISVRTAGDITPGPSLVRRGVPAGRGEVGATALDS